MQLKKHYHCKFKKLRGKFERSDNSKGASLQGHKTKGIVLRHTHKRNNFSNNNKKIDFIFVDM